MLCAQRRAARAKKGVFGYCGKQGGPENTSAASRKSVGCRAGAQSTERLGAHLPGIEVDESYQEWSWGTERTWESEQGTEARSDSALLETLYASSSCGPTFADVAAIVG